MPAEARDMLMRQQAELVRALVARGPVPAGFDAGRVSAAARSLIGKRLYATARSWPGLAEAVGDDFPALFRSYAEATPMPGCATPLGDGRAFLRWLQERGLLPDAVRELAFAFDLRYRLTARGVARRRWPVLRVARLGRLVIALRVPGLGEWWWRANW